MKKLILTSLMLFTLSQLFSQSFKELRDIYIKNNGGKEFLEKLNTMKMTGEVVTEMGNFPIEINIINNELMRQDFEIMGSKNYVIITKEKTIMFMPIQGMTEPKEIVLPIEEAKNIDDQFNIRGVLLDEKNEDKYSISIEEMDGDKVYVLKSKDTSFKETLYFSLDNLNKLKDEKIDKKGNVLINEFAKYSKVMDNINLPFSIKNNMGEVVVKEYILNHNISKEELLK